MIKNKSIRQCISTDEKEFLIYGTDSFAQFPRRNPSINSKCDRALPVASHDDVVVLRGKLDSDYYNWLKSHGLGPDLDNIVQYGEESTDFTLSELIIKNPEPIMKIIHKAGTRPVYVPWFSGETEKQAARAIGAELFGASEPLTLKYNDKSSFKNICRELDVPVVDGHLFKVDRKQTKNCFEMGELVESFLSIYEMVIIRGTVGDAGMSLYKTDGSNTAGLYRQIAATGEKELLIEPFHNVSFSPSDHWVIDRDGKSNYIGLRNQTVAQGMIHVGTLKGETFPEKTSDYIVNTSAKIVEHMAKSGYIGVVGIDYIVSDEGIFPIENNARFNASSYIDMLVDNIEKTLAPAPYWEYKKVKIDPCSFESLAKRMEPLLYDGAKTNSVFPFNCDRLTVSGDFSIVILAQDYNNIADLKKSLKDMGIK